MTVGEKLRYAIAEGEPLDWDQLHNELDAEHANAQTPRERENVLALFTIVADMVERIDTTATTVADFRLQRHQIYQELLLREAGLDGNASAAALDAITAREVAKGRMLQDDPMRLAAQSAFARLSPPPVSPPPVTGRSDDPDGEGARFGADAGAFGKVWQRWFAGMAAHMRRALDAWRSPAANRTV